MTAKTVHIDKLKAYLGTPPCSWLPATTGDSNTTVDPCTATSLLPPDVLIGPILPPSIGQQTVPRPVNQQRDGGGKQRDVVSDQPSSALPPPEERGVESECSMPNASSIQWETVRIPEEIVENKGSKPDNSGVQWNAVLVPASSESRIPGNSSAQWSPVLTPVREETEETGASSVQWNTVLIPVEEVLPDSRRGAVESESSKPDASSVQLDAFLIPVGRETEETGASSVQWDAVLTLVSGEIVADAPAFDHVTTSAAVVRGKGESVETAGRPLPVPAEVHATPAGELERKNRDVAGKSWKRCRAHTGAAWQRGNKGRKPSGTVTADIHPVYDHNKPVHAMTYSQLPPGDGVPSVPKRDKTADTDRSRVISPERPSFVLNSLANECVSASSKFERSRERGNGWEASACPYGSACDSSPGIVE